MTNYSSAKSRRRILKGAVAAAIAAATPASLIAATIGDLKTSTPSKTVAPTVAEMKLADGRRLRLTRKDRSWHGQLLDRYGRVVSKVARGNFRLASGKPLNLDRRGLVVFGAVSTRNFLQCIDPPDCGEGG